MPSYLIVANQTLGSPTLAAAVAERIAAGAASFHVVVPATPIQHRLTWNEDEANAVAEARLDALLAHLRELGAEASGEVGSPNPVDAVQDALRERDADEIILSTLPPGISRWLPACCGFWKPCRNAGAKAPRETAGRQASRW